MRARVAPVVAQHTSGRNKTTKSKHLAEERTMYPFPYPRLFPTNQLCLHYHSARGTPTSTFHRAPLLRLFDLHLPHYLCLLGLHRLHYLRLRSLAHNRLHGRMGSSMQNVSSLPFHRDPFLANRFKRQSQKPRSRLLNL